VKPTIENVCGFTVISRWWLHVVATVSRAIGNQGLAQSLEHFLLSSLFDFTTIARSRMNAISSTLNSRRPTWIVPRAPSRGLPAQLDTLFNALMAVALLLLCAPLMLYVAWRIWREDGAPILFGHYRVGRDGQLFRCWKFRTMVCRADEALAELLARDPVARAQWEREHKLDDDPRITPIGRFLRKTSLDELPQLFNVVRGEMRLVGPRPIVVQELRRYGAVKRHYLSVNPGMTGLWQVSGRNNTSYEERVELDRHYVESRSLWMDFMILVRTARVVITGHGAR
jgi:exopolysaccharide production protein ExoY